MCEFVWYELFDVTVCEQRWKVRWLGRVQKHRTKRCSSKTNPPTPQRVRANCARVWWWWRVRVCVKERYGERERERERESNDTSFIA